MNNTYEPQDTTVYTTDGSSVALHLDANEIKWYAVSDTHLDVYKRQGYGSGRKLFTRPLLPSVRDLLITAGILSCITLIGFIFLQLDFARYNIITVSYTNLDVYKRQIST